MFQFIPLRVKEALTSAEDLDGLVFGYKLFITHHECLTFEMLTHAVDFDPEVEKFGVKRGFFIHPCVRLSGWNTLLQKYFSMAIHLRETHPELVNQTMDGQFTLPHLPPPLWNLPLSALQDLVYLRPPKIFWRWSETLEKGEKLIMDVSDDEDQEADAEGEDEEDEIEDEMQTAEKMEEELDVDMEKGKDEVGYSSPIMEDDLANDEDFMREMEENMENALREADSDT